MAYNSDIFDVRSPSEAKNIILTPQDGLTPEQRWRTETPYLVELIHNHTNKGSFVLDYGCGIGRLSKEMVNVGRYVTGVDISWSMRALANDNVRSERFMDCSPEWFYQLMLVGKMGYDLGLAVWTLQHCENPEKDIYLIQQALTPRAGQLFVVNNRRRVVPTDKGWVDDGLDIDSMLREACKECLYKDVLDPNIVGPVVSGNTFWAVYQF